MEAAMEDARVAEANYAKDPFDSHNLTKWGKTLFLLSCFKNGQDSKNMMEDAILKLQEAAELDPFKHYTLWLLGKCFNMSALKTHDPDEVKGNLHKALAYFKKASRGDPGNQIYIRSVQRVTKELEKNKNIRTIVEIDENILTIAFDELSVGAASSEAKAPETDKELHANVEVDKSIHSNAETDIGIHNNTEMDTDIHSSAEMDNELHTNVEMDMDIHTNVEIDKGIHTNAEMDRTGHTKVEMDDDIHTNVEMDKDIHTNKEMGVDIHNNKEMGVDIHNNAETDKGIHTN